MPNTAAHLHNMVNLDLKTRTNVTAVWLPSYS